MNKTIVSECIIKRISIPHKKGKGMFENEFKYLIEIHSPTKRSKDKYSTYFNEPTKAKLLKHLKEEYMI